MKATKKTLPNGIRLIMIPLKDNPAMTVMALTEAGSKNETLEQNGLAHFFEHMAMKGGMKYNTPYAVSSTLDKLGAESNAMTGHEYTGYYAKAHPKYFKKVLDVIADVYISPRLDEAELEKERGVILEEINMYEDFPPRHVVDLFYATLYGDQPAGRPILGPRDNIKTFTRDDFIKFHEKNYVAENTIVIVSGSFDKKEVVKEVQKAFADMPTVKPKKRPKVKEVQKTPQLTVERKETDQTHLLMGVRAFKASDKRIPALQVLKAVLGGGMSGRLFQKLREDMGVCYYVKAPLDLQSDHGFLGVSAGVDKKRLVEVVDVIRDEMKRFTTELVDEKELKKAKDYTIGTMFLGLETSDSVADFFVDQEIYTDEFKTPNQIAKEIRAVTADDVKKVAKSIFKDNRLNLAVVGNVEDETKIKKVLKF